MRPYVPVSVDFFGDDRVIEVSPLARLEYVACLVIAKRNESDGRVTLAQVRRENPDMEDHDLLLKELVARGLLEPSDDHKLAIPAATWSKWNKTRAELEELRATRAVAGAKGGRVSGLGRAKQVASTGLSTVLEQCEAAVEPNTPHHTTPTTEGEDKKTVQRRRPSRPVPADFAVTEATRLWARSHNLAHIDLDRECERFVAHYRAKDSRFADWDAAFHSWLLNILEWSADQEVTPSSPPCACGAPAGTKHYPTCSTLEEVPS